MYLHVVLELSTESSMGYLNILQLQEHCLDILKNENARSRLSEHEMQFAIRYGSTINHIATHSHTIESIA